MVTDDQETNIIIPDNLGSTILHSEQKSTNTALRYINEISDTFTLGSLMTNRQSNDGYNNTVIGLDTDLRITNSDRLEAHVYRSNTRYAESFSDQYCNIDKCPQSTDINCTYSDCPISIYYHRTDKAGYFSDNAYQLRYSHRKRKWNAYLTLSEKGEDFRGDLGYITNIDIRNYKLSSNRYFFFNKSNWWYKNRNYFNYSYKTNVNNELISKNARFTTFWYGQWQSDLQLTASHTYKAGKRQDLSNLNIENNSDYFNEYYIQAYYKVSPAKGLDFISWFDIGNKIDYANNRLGDYWQLTSKLNWNINRHLELNFKQIFTKMTVDNQLLYQVTLSDLRLNYQFNSNSLLKLAIKYKDKEQNPDNYLYRNVHKKNKSISSQLVYSYKLNAQSVFFAGYSDSGYENDNMSSLKRDERAVFVKFSYGFNV